jgi:23S rRNA (cytosine1962-C5)-methyltransferase
MQKLFLKKNEERRLFAGHHWVFSNELQSVPKTIPAGDTVALHAQSEKFLGVGFYNPNSLIAFRLLSRDFEPIDASFFEKRFRAAHLLRQKLYPESNTYRLVHAESDELTGLIIDRFDTAFSIQTFSAGMEKHLDTIAATLKKLFAPDVIVLRNESELRPLEGLELYQNVVLGDAAQPVTIHDAGIQYRVDILHGHKTGFFLDQRENRKKIRPFSKGKTVLDVFTSDGGFALNAAYAGAKNVLAIDASADALKRVQENAALNKLSSIETRQSDAFKAMEKLVEEKRTFDVVVIDPPSLTKSKKTVDTALQAYKRLNTLALKLVAPSGILATSSCSHHVDEDTFLDVVRKSSNESKRFIQLLEKSSQAPDHPILLAMPETKYLKFALFAVK